MGASSLKLAAQRAEELRTSLSHHRFLCVLFLIREIMFSVQRGASELMENHCRRPTRLPPHVLTLSRDDTSTGLGEIQRADTPRPGHLGKGREGKESRSQHLLVPGRAVY